MKNKDPFHMTSEEEAALNEFLSGSPNIIPFNREPFELSDCIDPEPCWIYDIRTGFRKAHYPS